MLENIHEYLETSGYDQLVADLTKEFENAEATGLDGDFKSILRD